MKPASTIIATRFIYSYHYLFALIVALCYSSPTICHYDPTICHYEKVKENNVSKNK